MKHCPKCDIDKPFSDFNKNRGRKDGLNGYCKSCHYNTYKEDIKKRVVRWQKENIEKSRAFSRQNWWNHREARLEYSAQWRRNNSDKWNEYSRRRKALKSGNYTYDDFLDLCKKYGHICLRCKQKKPLTVDHIVPLSRGGADVLENIQPLCKSCNSSKHTKIEDYRQAVT